MGLEIGGFVICMVTSSTRKSNELKYVIQIQTQI